jgi:flagellar motor switch protein FliN/FliY
VTETIEYEQFDQSAAASGADSGSEVDLSRLSEIPMELSVEIGRTHMTVGETLDLRVGSVVTLERLAGETADLLVNGSAIARGEVVVIDEQYGLRITEILDGHVDSALSAEGDREQPPSAGNIGSEQDPVPSAAQQEPAGAAIAGESPAEESTPA